VSPARSLAALLDAERRRALRRLRGHAPLDDDARENELVAAVGVVRPLEETLVAPLSGRACVAYRSRVRIGWWNAAIQTPSGTCETMQVRPFLLDLGDEEIIVVGDRAIFGLAPLRLAPDAVRERSFLARHALLSARPSQQPAARFSEVALEPGARIAVGGTLVLVPREEPPSDVELGFRDPPPPSPRIAGNRERPLVFAEPAGPAE
jgi:hypothetical protein